METKFEIFKELFDLSLHEKRGLTIFLQGQAIAGVVTKIVGATAIELKSQTYRRAVVPVESIEAIALV